MSIIDDIQLILNILEQQKASATNWESFLSSSAGNHQDGHFHHLLQQYESLRNITARASLVLLAVREELEDSKQKNHQTEVQLEGKKSELHNMQEIAEKLQDKISHFEREEDSLREEISHLHLVLSEKEKEVEQREEANGSQAAHLREENYLLQQHIQDICVKYKNLEIIAEQEARKRERLQEEITAYRKHEREMESTLNALNSKLNAELQLHSVMERELKERQAKVLLLEGKLIDSTRELMAELSDYELGDESKGLEQEEITEIPTDLKLLQLSQQISYNEKAYINLNLSEHSFEASIQERTKNANHAQEKLNEMLKTEEQSEDRPLRKVASNVELSSRKRIVSKQAIILRELSDDISQDFPSKDAKEYFNGIRNRAQNRLKDLYQLNSGKVIIQTQGTDRECETDRSILPDEEKPFRRTNSLLSHLTDPYYIHYQLTVQSIKIEEDEEGMFGILEIDMKPHYEELVASKLPISKWADWIRRKLLSLSGEEEEQAL